MLKRSVRAVCIALLLVTLCSAASAETAISPTTGIATDKPYRPLLVQVSNARDARPPWGLSKADIVYEAVIWKPNHTRYLALFNDQHPDKVGSIRGSRVFWCELREAWDCPIVIAGGQAEAGTSIFDFFDERRVPPEFIIDSIVRPGVGSGWFSRDEKRVSPHNGVFNLSKIVENAWPQKDGKPYEPRLPGLVFDSVPTRGDEPATVVTVSYDQLGKDPEQVGDSYIAGYAYNSESRLYERSYNNRLQTDFEGESIVAANVIVQEIPLSFFEDIAARPVMDTTGEGKIDAFIDGTHISGVWKRESLDDQTRFLDANGETLKLLPGKTFIQIVPIGFAVAFE